MPTEEIEGHTISVLQTRRGTRDRNRQWSIKGTRRHNTSCLSETQSSSFHTVSPRKAPGLHLCVCVFGGCNILSGTNFQTVFFFVTELSG